MRLALLAAVLVLVASPSHARAAQGEGGAAPGARGAVRPASGGDRAARAARRHGIRVTAVRLTAGGTMLDLRYRVTDPERARVFLARKHAEVFLVDEATGARLGVPTTPKLGPLRQRVQSVRTDRDYFALFANPGRQLRRGARVTLVAGDLRIPHLAVE